MEFKRITHGLNHSSLIPATDDLDKIVKTKPESDWYSSLYSYSKEHFDQFQSTKSVAGIRGLKTNRLLFDFDSAQDVELARKDAIELCERLIESGVPEDKIRVSFSGAKGFHVEMVLKQILNRQEFVNITHHLAADLKTFDTRINDEARVIRLPLTKHPKSGLYKIPLSVDDLRTMTVPEIQVNAVEVSGYDAKDLHDSLWVQDLPAAIIPYRDVEYKRVSTSSDTTIEKLTFDISDIDFTKCPRWMAKERFALQEGFFQGSSVGGKGERNSGFMILAATYRGQGFSEDHALGLLLATAERQAQRSGEEAYTEEQLRREILATVYSPSWRGGIFGKGEELLIATRQRFNVHDDIERSGLVQIDDVGNKFKNFAKNFDTNRILTGIKSLDDNIVLTTGMAVGLLGAPGSGKTTVLNAIVENLSAKGLPCIYQSLDMSDNLLYLRMLQKHTGYSIEKILTIFRDETPDPKLKQAYAEVLKNFSNVHFNFRSGMTVDDMDEDITKYKQETGLSPKLIAVDYLEKVRSSMSDPTISSGYVASRLSDLAKKHEACVIVLLQPQKSAGDASQPLLSMRKVKGASQIEQDLRAILTVWRPGADPQNPQNDKYMSMAIVKNNLGQMNQMDFLWNGATGVITELDQESRRDLKRLREELEEKQANTNSGWDL